MSAGGMSIALGMLWKELRSSSSVCSISQSLTACGSWCRRLERRSRKERRGSLQMEDDTCTMLLLLQFSRSSFLMFSISYGISVKSLLDMSTDVSCCICRQAAGNCKRRMPATMRWLEVTAASRERRYLGERG